MKLEQAQLIAELLCNAGWLDDADELLGGLIDDAGEDQALKKAQEVDRLIVTINRVLPQDEQICTNRTMVDTFNQLI